MIMKLSQRQKGICFVIIEAFGFALMTFFVKMAGALPTIEKCFFRNLPAVFIAAYILKKEGIKYYVPKAGRKDLLIRCIAGAAGMIANFYAIDQIGIADTSILNKMSPFFAMLLSIPILKEKPSRKDWIFTGIAFFGVIFVIKPTSGIASIPALIALFGGFGAGMAYTFVRRLGQHNVNGSIIVFSFSAFTCLVCIPLMMLNFKPMSLNQFLLLLCAGLGGAIGQFGVTAAYKYAPAKEISVFDYTQVIFAAILGFIGFNEVPDFMSIVGYAIIIGMAVLKWWVTNKEERSEDTEVESSV